MTAASYEDVYPLTPVQQGLLFHHLYAPDESLYLDQVVLPLCGELRLPAFVAAWRGVVARHAALRTSFHWQDLAQPLQVVHHEALLPVAVVDLAALPAAAREPARASLLAADRRRGVELGRPPLTRLTVMRLAPQEHAVVWSYHHLLLDAWSGSILFREVFTLYQGEMRGKPVALPPARPFRLYTRWLQGQDGSAAEAFWRRELAGVVEATPLPADGSEEGAGGGEVRGEVAAELGAEATSTLARFASRERLTLNTLVQGAWALALARATGCREVVFGATVSGRPPALPGVEAIVGMLVNTLPVRVALPGEVEVGAWLRDLQRRGGELARFESSSLATIQALSELGAGRPLFESILAFENVPGAELARAGNGAELRLTVGEPHYLFRTHYPLTAQVLPGASLRIRLAFDRGRISRCAAARFLARLLAALEELCHDPRRRLAALNPLSTAERQALGWEWCGGATPYARESTLDRLVAARVEAAPAAVALVFGEEVLSYGEFGARAAELAAALAARGVGPDVRVGVALERSLELVVALLATLEAGGAFVPLDPELPAERLALLAEEAGVAVVLSRAAEAARLPPLAAPLLAVDALPHSPAAPLKPRALPESLCYVLFTSGSTGRPKGVATPHRAVVRLVDENPFVHFGAGETLFHAAPAAFDASTFELWGALAHGARLVVARHGPLGLEELADLLARHRVSTFWVTTGLFHQLAEEMPEIFTRLPQVLTGGELALPQLFGRVLAKSPRSLLLFHAYGPTECTTFATGERLRGGQLLAPEAPVPIGRAIANTRLRVLGDAGDEVPAGAPGELFVGGDGLARGYLDRPGFTAARFVPDGASREPGARLYRTGDRVRWLADGRLVFLGRRDQQVKIRGFRIEPGEVEAALLRHPALAAGLVAVREDRPGERRLVAYVVPAGEGPRPELKRELRAHLGDLLPAYMVPAAFVVLPSLPLNANGKVDRRALPPPEDSVSAEPGARRGAASELEAELILLWSHLLGVSEVGPEDDFFELGGHSLLATRLVSRVRQTFGVEVALRTIFEHPTVAGLAATIRAARVMPAAPQAGPTAAAPGAGLAPLSFAQERLWFLDRLEPGLTAYNVPFALLLDGRLEAAVLARALGEVLARHAVLRSRLVEVDGAGYQEPLPAAPVALPVIELTGLGEPLAAARELAARELSLPFDLTRPPLLRARLLRLAPARHLALLTLHHVACDGWSMGVLFEEVTRLYDAFAAGRPSPLPPLALQVADVAAWQRGFLTGSELARQLGFWQRQLAQLPPILDLPLDRPRPAVQTYRGGSCPVAFSAPLAQSLAELATSQRVTLFMVLLAGFGLTLSRITGSRDLAVGTAVANRNRAETEALIGFFVNTLVLRLDLGGGPTVREVLARVREVTLAAYAHQDLPFERLVAEMAGARNLAVTPLFQVFFALQNTPLVERSLPGLAVTPLEIPSGRTKFDLQLTLTPLAGEIAGTLDYNADLFDGTTVLRLGRRLERLLAGMVARREARLSDLSDLDAAERWQLIGEWNDAPLPAEDGELLHSGFLAQAGRVPEAVALVVREERLSYAALLGRALELATRLGEEGVGPEVRVAVALERTAELPVALLGTLIAGGAYVPLDPAYPAARRAFMLADSGAAVVLGAGGLAVLSPPTAPVAAVEPRNLAYVIYTSGSTGAPKGVAITHGSAAAFCRWALANFSEAEFAGTLAATSISFDLSIFELFVPLAAGGRVLVVPNILHLAELEAAAEVRLINTVPSALTELLAEAELPPSVATVNLAGEALEHTLVEELYRRPGVARVQNLYGPSEDTTYSTVARLPRGGGAPPIGRPLAGTAALVLDVDLAPVPLGTAGLLCLAGAGLARGYLGRPAATALSFVPNPFARGARLYRTGDLARSRADGQLEFLGRADQQIKVRGFRIEPGEVEAALTALPGVRQAAVVAREAAGGTQLVAYVVGEGEPSAWRNHLRERLPAYLVPASFVALPALPHTASGKVDRRALPAPGGERAGAAAELLPPRTPTEATVAGLWAEVLGLERVGVRDNFFELGGHSLLLVRVQSRLRKTLGREVPIVELFAHPTVEALARWLERAAPEVVGFEHATERAAKKQVGFERRRARAGGAP